MSFNFNNLSNDELVNILVSNTPVGYIVLDRNYRIHYLNEYFMKMRNFTKENTLGRHCYDLSNNGKKCSVCAVESCILTKTKQKVIRKDILPGGESRFIEDYAIPLYKDDDLNFDFILEIMLNRTAEMQYREMLDNDFVNLIGSLITILDAKDEYTAQHSKSVARYSVMLANALQLSADQITEIEIAASLHDIGKVNIPYSILNKPGKLNELEFSTIKMHPGNAYVILQRLSGFYKVKESVRFHHERYDGKGYPEGLSGGEIPLGARIISLADTYDAMTSTRSYRKALSHEQAVAEITKNAGTQFDPWLAEVFVGMDFSAPMEKNPPPEKKKNLKLVERQLVETEDVKNSQKDSFMENMDGNRAFNQILPDQKFASEIFNNTPVAYALLSPEYDVLYASPHFLDTFEFRLKDIKDKKCYRVSGQENQCAHCPMEKAVAKKGLVEEQFTQTINGRTLHFDCFGMPIFDKNGDLQYILEILLDRTEEKRLQQEHEQGLYDIVHMLMDLLAVNDQETYKKSQFLSQICEKMAQELDITLKLEREIRLASSLCDIGMISLKDTAEDQEALLKSHPMVAFNILGQLSIFSNVTEIIKHHHEKYDGSGYPSGLAGEDIPLGSRIIALADSFYENSKLGSQYALNNIRNKKGKSFDPALADLFLAQYKEWLETL